MNSFAHWTSLQAVQMRFAALNLDADKESTTTYISVSSFDCWLKFVRQLVDDPKLPEAQNTTKGSKEHKHKSCDAELPMQACEVTFPGIHLKQKLAMITASACIPRDERVSCLLDHYFCCTESDRHLMITVNNNGRSRTTLRPKNPLTLKISDSKKQADIWALCIHEGRRSARFTAPDVILK